MLEGIFWIIISGLAIFGLVELLGILDRRFTIFRNDYKVYSIVPIKGHVTEMEYMVEDVVKNLEQADRAFHHKIVLLDMGADEETLKICELALREREEIQLVKEEDLDRVFL